MPHFDDEPPAPQFRHHQPEEVVSTEFDEDGGIDLGGGFSDENQGEATEAAEQLVANLTRESDDTESMSEAERRLDLAGYYRQLLHGFAFESEESGARQVENELRAFAEGRLQVLLGIRPDDRPRALPAPQIVVKPQFTDEEVVALRKFAAMSAAELKVFWAVLATASRSKSVMGAPPAPAPPAPKPAPTPPRVVQAPPQATPTLGIRRIAAPAPAPARAQAPAPASRVARPAPAAQPAPRTRQPAQQPAPPEEPPAPPPPKPLRMPRGKTMEGVLMNTAISQAESGERIDESYRRRGDPEGAKVQR